MMCENELLNLSTGVFLNDLELAAMRKNLYEAYFGYYRSIKQAGLIESEEEEAGICTQLGKLKLAYTDAMEKALRDIKIARPMMSSALCGILTTYVTIEEEKL